MCDISPIEWEALIPKENLALVFSTLEFNKDCGYPGSASHQGMTIVALSMFQVPRKIRFNHIYIYRVC